MPTGPSGGSRTLMAAAALAGFVFVLMAAAGSHWLPGLDDPAAQRRLNAALLINGVHAVVLLALALISPAHPLLRRWAPLAFVVGIILFCGSLYGSLAGLFDSTRFAPAGGLALMLGWLMLVWHALSGRQATG